jgi:hypothetical protein
MSHESELELEVKDVIRRNRWLTLSTASLRGAPQGSVVVYASDGYTMYILTGKRSAKFRNIARNPRVSVTIPFYKSLIHRLITIAPPAAVSFRAPRGRDWGRRLAQADPRGLSNLPRRRGTPMGTEEPRKSPQGREARQRVAIPTRARQVGLKAGSVGFEPYPQWRYLPSHSPFFLNTEPYRVCDVGRGKITQIC